MQYTFKLRPGVKFHGATFTPTRDLNADDVIFSFERQWKADHPYANKYVGRRSWDYFHDMGMADLIDVDRERSTTTYRHRSS